MKKIIPAIISIVALLTVTLFAKNLDSGLWDLTSQIDSRLPKAISNQKPKIAIVDFTSLDGHDSEVGRLVAEELLTRLSGSGKVVVVERKLLRKIADEHKLTLSGMVDESTARQIGKILGVTYICSGTVAELAESVRINARVIRADTAELITTAGVEVSDPSLDPLLKNKPRRKTPDNVDSGRRQNDKPRSLNAVGSAQLPRTMEQGSFASVLTVSDNGLNAGVQISVAPGVTIGISENFGGILGGGGMQFSIPGLQAKWVIVDDVNGFSLAAGFDNLMYGSLPVTNALAVVSNSTLFYPQGFYACMGWGYSLLGEKDMWAAGIRFPILPIQSISLGSTSLYAISTFGLSRYLTVGLMVENFYLNIARWDELLGSVSLSFIPIRDIDITLLVQWQVLTGRWSRLLSFGYEYRF